MRDFGRWRFSLPWGLRQRCRIPPAQRSGAHLNPSATLTFLSLGQVKVWDALVFILVQFAAGDGWTHAWVYYTAPMLDMQTAVFLHRLIRPTQPIHCAKLDHPDNGRCIYCGHELTPNWGKLRAQ